MSKMQTFYYKAWIMRNDRRICREGSIKEKYPLDALDAIVVTSIETWKTPILRIELFELNEHGELIATSSVGDRVNAVLATNAKLRPGKYKNIQERRKLAAEALSKETPNVPTVIPKKPAVVTPVSDNAHNWTVRHGSRYITQSFVTLKTLITE